jgi:hypothetical protein
VLSGKTRRLDVQFPFGFVQFPFSFVQFLSVSVQFCSLDLTNGNPSSLSSMPRSTLSLIPLPPVLTSGERINVRISMTEWKLVHQTKFARFYTWLDFTVDPDYHHYLQPQSRLR